MQHTWNKQTGICNRCGLVRVNKKQKVTFPDGEVKVNYYNWYFDNGKQIEFRKCYDPTQIKLFTK